MKNLTYLFIVSLLFLSCESDKEIISKAETEGENLSNSKFSKYDNNEEGIHYALLISDNVEVEKEKVESFNLNKEKNKTKRVSSIVLKTKDEEKINCLVIRRFDSLKEAKNYLLDLKTELDLKDDRKIYEISQVNYRMFLKNKEVEGYDKFYQNKE